MIISVLEHLVNPRAAIQSAHRLLKPSGLLLINVPTWRGKRFLEFSAFRLGLSPKVEMDDHKMYYDKRDLWPFLVRSGFKPSQIRLRYHKFGLNLFAVAQEEAPLNDGARRTRLTWRNGRWPSWPGDSQNDCGPSPRRFPKRSCPSPGRRLSRISSGCSMARVCAGSSSARDISGK